jgi:RimJ/RimL family protein N-acetyltransferase
MSTTHSIKVTEMTPDRLEDLVEVLTSCSWDYFVNPVHTRESALKMWNDGDLSGPDSAGYFVEIDGGVAGLIRLHDLEDDTPLFDVRLREDARGHGLGAASVRWVINYFFSEQDRSRIEAQTRSDNLAMRATLRSCGFVKEGHYRASDPAGNDWVAYGLLRTDWESGTTTPVPWDDE